MSASVEVITGLREGDFVAFLIRGQRSPNLPCGPLE